MDGKCILFPKVCQGRVLDYKRKFIEAASRYNELSYKTAIHERSVNTKINFKTESVLNLFFTIFKIIYYLLFFSERMTALQNATICTILAAAGTSTYTLPVILTWLQKKIF
jgi:hypothetical protein